MFVFFFLRSLLAGSGYVEFFGPTVQRLQRGEAVSLHVALESPEGKLPAQLSLQVTMLDTDWGGGGGGGGERGKTVRCCVLVHSAANLPTAAAEDGGKVGGGVRV